MSNALRKPMTIEEFLEWEARQPLRYEFDGFQPIAMAGGTEQHSAIQRNLAIAVGGAAAGQTMPLSWQRSEDRYHPRRSVTRMASSFALPLSAAER